MVPENKSPESGKDYWLPTIPYNLIDAINRCAVATGSPRYAAAGADADYNGHRVGVHFNDYRQYWVAEYSWAGRNVLGRGSVEGCLRAAKAEYDRGAKGAMVVAGGLDAAGVAAAESLGYVPWTEATERAHYMTWCDPRSSQISTAFWYERNLGIPAVGMLANSIDLADYKAKVDAAVAERAARMNPK